MNHYLYAYQSSSQFMVKLPQGFACFSYTYRISIRAIDNGEGATEFMMQNFVKEEPPYLADSKEIFEQNLKLLNEGNFQETCQAIISIATYFNHLNFLDKASLSKLN
jgi:hypothetical protein